MLKSNPLNHFTFAIHLPDIFKTHLNSFLFISPRTASCFYVPTLHCWTISILFLCPHTALFLSEVVYCLLHSFLNARLLTHTIMLNIESAPSLEEDKEELTHTTLALPIKLWSLGLTKRWWVRQQNRWEASWTNISSVLSSLWDTVTDSVGAPVYDTIRYEMLDYFIVILRYSWNVQLSTVAHWMHCCVITEWPRETGKRQFPQQDWKGKG